MSENDYIAEYIKEKYPALLGFDYAMWKFVRQMAKTAKTVAEMLSSINEEEYRDE